MTGLKVAVVGVGALGRHHARILSELSGVELVAVADSHAERGQDIAQRCGTTWVADYRDLPPGLDAVSIVVPTVAHHEVASHFLEQQTAVLVEKPLANCRVAAEELADLAESRGALLQVGHIERFNPAFQAARAACRDARYIKCERVSPFTFRSTDIGVVHDLMIHDLDLVLSIVQCDAVRVEAFGCALMGPHEDLVQARITFANGCIADLTASRVSPTLCRQMQAWTASGCVTVDLHQRQVTRQAPTESLLFGTSPVELARQPQADVEQMKKDVFGHWIHTDKLPVAGGDALTLELEHFLHCIETGGQPLVGGQEAVAAMRLAEQVLESVARHEWYGQASGPVGPRFTMPQPARKAA